MAFVVAFLLSTPVTVAMAIQPVHCSGPPAALPAGMEGWARTMSVRAAAKASTATSLHVGVGALATLLPTPKVAYVVPPDKPGAPASSGGIFAFAVSTAGRYRVALGSGAWIDVLHGKTPVVSVAHGHGPACSTVRKMVDFDLQPGRYLLQVAGSNTATLAMMVSRLP